MSSASGCRKKNAPHGRLTSIHSYGVGDRKYKHRKPQHHSWRTALSPSSPFLFAPVDLVVAV